MGWVWLISVANAGPYDVESVDVEFTDAHYGRGLVEGRVYAPTDDGAYPIVAMMHGWLGFTDVYDEICEAVASEGFVVASINTQTGLFLDIPTFAEDTLALVAYTEDQGLGDGGDLVAMGHSMGGGTLGSLVALEPRVRTVVGFMPYVGENAGYDAMASFDGAALYFAGTDDTTAPTYMQEQWFETADIAGRSLFAEIGGGGHQAVLDVGIWSDGSLDFQVQLELVKDMTTAFIRAEHFGEEDHWVELAGDAAPDHLVDLRSAGHEPVIWAELDGETAVTVGVAGRPDGVVTLLAGSDAELTTPVELGSAALVDGLASVVLPIDDWTDDLYLRAVVDADGTTTPSRTLALITGGGTQPGGTPGGTEPQDPGGSTDDGGDPAQGDIDADGKGCATAPAPWGLAWLPLLLLRRRTS